MKALVKRAALAAKRVLDSTATGPASDTTVAAGGTADITFTLPSPFTRPASEIGVKNVTGLPSGVYIAAIAVDPENKTVTLTLANPGASDVTVAANSITLEAVLVN